MALEIPKTVLLDEPPMSKAKVAPELAISYLCCGYRLGRGNLVDVGKYASRLAIHGIQSDFLAKKVTA
jgi:hypothetical protein